MINTIYSVKYFRQYVLYSVMFFLFALANVNAQINNYKFENLSVSDGLSQTSVYSITQDKDGFLWVGTQDGLNRYDGYTFKIYRYDPYDKTSLSNSSVSSIFQDKKGNIWVGTWGGGLNKYDPYMDSFIHFVNDPSNPKSIAHNRVPVIFQDSKERLWIGTAGAGIDQFNPATNEFIHFRHMNNDQSISHDRIWGITEDKKGNLWIATEDGITKYNPDSQLFKIYRNNPSDNTSLSHNRGRAIFCDSEGIVWVGTEVGLNRYNEKTDNFTRYLSKQNGNSLSFNIINFIYEGENQNIFICTYGGGLDIFDKKNDKFYHFNNDPDNPESISNNDVRCIAVDKSNIIWIGTRGGGLDKFSLNRVKFNSLAADSRYRLKLSDKIVRAISEDNDGNLWIGTNGNGINKFNRKENLITAMNTGDGLSNNRVTSIETDDDGYLWLGTDTGLNKFDIRNNRFKIYQSQKDNSNLNHNQIISLYDDKKGNLWVGTYGGGLNKLDKKTGKFIHFIHDDSGNSISNNEVWHIAPNKNGNLWLSTSDGLNKFDPVSRNFKVYKSNSSKPDHLSSNNIWCSYEDKNGILWVGTTVGLNRLNPSSETFTRYTQKNGLPNDVVYGILPDDKGNLWLSTNKGISKFNPAKATFKNFDEDDGLLSNVFYQGAFYRSKSGELFFGSTKGLNYFKPENIIENDRIPGIEITGLSIFQKEINGKNNQQLYSQLKKGSLTVPYDQNFITIYFSSMDFTNPAKNEYKYMLEGVDKDWIDAGKRRYANYTNLDPGKYTFLVKGSNDDGKWNIKGAVLTINIKPPFWSTWWFYSIIILTVLTTAVTGYQYRIKNLKKRQKELLKLIDERKNVEEELRFSRERFELAVNGSNDGLWDWKVGTDEVYYSARWKELLGYGQDEITNKFEEFDKLIHPEDKPRVYESINNHVEKGSVFDIEFRMLTKAGEYKWFRSRGGSVRDENGKSIRMSGSTTDISERKKNETLNSVLYDISKAINASENLDELFVAIHKHLGNIFDTKNFFVGLYDQENDMVTFPYFVDEIDEKYTIVDASKSDSLTVQIVQTGKPLFVSEQELIDRRYNSGKQYWGSLSKSWVGVPLILREHVIGAIAMQSYTNSEQFSANDIPVLSIIGEQVAIAIDRKRAENALKESEVRFRALIENSSDITFILDETGYTIFYSSPSVERILGYQPGELVMTTGKLEVHPEDRPYLSEKLKEIIEKPVLPVLFELRLKHKDGYWKYFEAAGTNLLKNNAINGIVINLSDITERKSAEEEIQKLNQDLEKRIDIRTTELIEANTKLQSEITERLKTLNALKESEERTRLVIDTALDAVVTVDAESRIVRWNQRAEEIFGWPKEEVIGKTLMDTVIPEEHHDAHRHGMKRFIETGKGRIINTLVEINACHRDGHGFPVELAISNIKIDGKHTFSAFIRDITLRKKQEEKLKASEEKYRLLIENASEAILIAQDGIITFANPRATQLSGFTFEELSAGPFVFVVHPDDRPLVMDRYKKRLMGDTELQNYEFRIITKSGKILVVEINAILIMWEGRPATLNFLADITERKKAEQEIIQALAKEKELNELKSRFVSMASHEFRTPLTSILGSAEIIERYGDKLSEDKKLKSLHRIQENVKHMTQLLNDILIIGKSDAGKLEINPELVDLNMLCEIIVEQFDMQIKGKSNHTIHYNYKNLDKDFMLDSKLMKQIIENLISNAIKYSPEGGDIYLNVESDDGNLSIKIKDSGLGIPADDLPRLFEPFHRAKNVGSVSGTGLGLSIVKRAVEIHNGNISVESILNEGTTFFISIPVNGNNNGAVHE